MIRSQSAAFSARASANVRQILVCAGAMIGATVGGAYIAMHDALSSARYIVGLPLIVTWLRYPYALLLCWALVDPFIGHSTVPLFSGNNFDTALTIPTFLLLPTLPVAQTLRRIPGLILFMGFLLCVLPGIETTPLSHGDFLKQWVLTLDYVAVAILAVNILSTHRRLLRFIDAMLFVSTIIALYGILGYVTHRNVVTDGTGVARITSFFDSVPALSLLLSIVIPVALYRLYVARGVGRAVMGLIFCVLLVALALTFTRGALASVALSLVIALVLIRSRVVRAWLLGVGGAGLVIASFSHISLAQRFYNADISTLNGRTYLWNALLSNVDPHQIFGHGLDASNVLLANLAIGGNAHIAGAVATSASNLYVGVLYDQGIAGLSVLLLTFVALGVSLILGIRRSAGEHRVLFVMALVALVNVLVQSIEQNDILAQSIGVYFWMVMALPFAESWYVRISRAAARGELPAGRQVAPNALTDGRATEEL